MNGDKKIASLPFIEHLRQVLDVDMDEARFAVLEGLGTGLLALGQDLQGAQLRHAVAPQAAIKPQVRNSRIDELARDQQQVIQRQKQHAPEFNHDGLLTPGSGRASTST